MKALTRSLAILLLSACSPATEPADSSASWSPLRRAAEAAVAQRNPTVPLTDVFEVQGLRENALCGKLGDQQVIYREKRALLLVQSDVDPAGWISTYRNWCIESPRL